MRGVTATAGSNPALSAKRVVHDHSQSFAVIREIAQNALRIDTTVHGFRSSFRDWTAEQTSFPRDVCEMALAHSIGNAVEAAYRRGDLFEKRRKLMAAWSRYVLAEPASKVLPMRRIR